MVLTQQLNKIMVLTQQLNKIMVLTKKKGTKSFFFNLNR